MAKGKAGNTKTEGGKSYVQTSSGLWVSADSDSGKNGRAVLPARAVLPGTSPVRQNPAPPAAQSRLNPGVNPGTEPNRSAARPTYRARMAAGTAWMTSTGRMYITSTIAGSGSNKNGSTQRTQVAGAYTGNGKGGYDGTRPIKIQRASGEPALRAMSIPAQEPEREKTRLRD